MEENDNNIRRKIRSLDDDFPKVDWTPEDVWESVGKKRPVRYIGWSIAATLLVGATIFFWPTEKEKVTITYREENIAPDTLHVNTSWSLIEESCRENVVVCESKEFIYLKTQWDDLRKESEALNQQEEAYGKNPAISRAKQKVESVKQHLEKEMMSMIES